ncbi:MAG: urea transporter permease [Verrucomicrobiales bacterium]|nr:urea transporter permease [Verrucomicrobiales bacterium]
MLMVGRASAGAAAEAQMLRTEMVKAMLSEDLEVQKEILKKFTETQDSWVQKGLAAWREGSVYLFETNDNKRVFILDSVGTDIKGQQKGVDLLTGEAFKAADGKVLSFIPQELTPIDTNSKLRKAIKDLLDVYSLSNPNRNMRRDAILKLGLDQNMESLPTLEARLKTEHEPMVVKAIREAISMVMLSSDKLEDKVKAVRELGELRSQNGFELLKRILSGAKKNPTSVPAELKKETEKAVLVIESYMWWGNLAGTFFRGVSSSAVLLVVALGLAITFGLMGVINMAHGELMIVGAYTTYVTQNVFVKWFGSSGAGFEWYFIVALFMSFFAGGTAGLILERTVIRFLYKRPLESLLATWGVSLVIQQIFRSIFGAANVQVNSPQWLTGNVAIADVPFAFNRLFVIVFALFIVLMTYLLLTRTSLGLQIRAVMQNRQMASCLGVKTERVNMFTFAFGSGLAGMAGACLSQIANVGPGLGQSYIVDCFMIVVLGGVGNLIGTITASFGIGITDQILQPFLGAVLGKITVLAAIILFLQWRPAGIFVTRSRSLEG